MANLLKIKRGTRAQLNAAVSGNSLNLGEPYLITDEGRLAVGTGSNTYATYSDGTPVHMQLTLQFQELTPIYAEDYDSTEGKSGVGY